MLNLFLLSDEYEHNNTEPANEVKSEGVEATAETFVMTKEQVETAANNIVDARVNDTVVTAMHNESGYKTEHSHEIDPYVNVENKQGDIPTEEIKGNSEKSNNIAHAKIKFYGKSDRYRGHRHSYC